MESTRDKDVFPECYLRASIFRDAEIQSILSAQERVEISEMNRPNKKAIIDSDVPGFVVDRSEVINAVIKDLKTLKAGIKLVRTPLKLLKPIEYELKHLPAGVSGDELEILKSLAKKTRVNGKKGRAITNSIKNNILKANNRKALQTSIDKFQARKLLDTGVKNLNIISKLLKSYNSALTACINLGDPNGIQGMPALVFEMLARSGEIGFVDGITGIIITQFGISGFPVVVTALAPVAISVLVLQPSWDLIESTARSLVKQLQAHTNDLNIPTNLNTLSHAEITSMLPNPIALIYDRNMEDLVQKWLPVVNPAPVVGLYFSPTGSGAQNAMDSSTLPEATAPQSNSNQKSTQKPEFKRHTIIDAGIKADPFGQPGLGFESQTQMSEQFRLRVAANLAGLTPQTRAISISGNAMYQGDNCSMHGGVSVYKSTAGVGAAIVGSIVTADGAVTAGFSSTYGWFVSLSAMTPWGAVAVTTAIVAVGAGLLTKKLLDNRAENFFPVLDNTLKANRKIAKLVARSCEKSLSKNEQKELRAAFQKSKISADAVGRKFLMILEYFQVHHSVESITALQTHDYQKLVALYDHAFQTSTAPIYTDIEAGHFENAYQKCVQLQRDFPENHSLNTLQISILDIIKFQEIAKPIYADIEAGDLQGAYQECTQIQQTCPDNESLKALQISILDIIKFQEMVKAIYANIETGDLKGAYEKCTQIQQMYPDNESLKALQQNISTQIVYYEALDILDKHGCSAAIQHFLNHGGPPQDTIRHHFALSVALVYHGNLSDGDIEYCKESIQRFLEISDIADSEKGTAYFCQAYFLSLSKDYAARQDMLTKLKDAHALNKTCSSIATLLAKEYVRRFQYEQARVTLQGAGEPTTLVDLAAIEHKQLGLMVFSNLMSYVLPFLKFMQPAYVRGLLQIEQITSMSSSGAFLLWRYQAELHLDAQQKRELVYFFDHCSPEEKAICKALLPYDKSLQQLRKLQLSISVLILFHNIASHLATKDGPWDVALKRSGSVLDVANTITLSTLSLTSMLRALEQRSQALNIYNDAIERSDTVAAMSSSRDAMFSLLDAASSAFFALVPICSYIDRNYYTPRHGSGHAPMNVSEMLLENTIWTIDKIGGLGLNAKLLYDYRNSIEDVLRCVVNACPMDEATIQNLHASIDLARQQLEAWSKEGLELTKDALQKIIEKLKESPNPTPEQVAIALGAAIVVAGGSYVYLRQRWYYNGINNTKIQLQLIRRDPENAGEYISESERYNTLVLTHFPDDETVLRQRTEIAINKLLLRAGFADHKKTNNQDNKEENPTNYEDVHRQYKDTQKAIALCDKAILDKFNDCELKTLRLEALLHAAKLAADINNMRKTHHNQQMMTNHLKKTRDGLEGISEKAYWSNRGLYWLMGEGQDYWKKTLELEMLEARYVSVLNAIKKLETYDTSNADWLEQLRKLSDQTHQAMQLFSKNITEESQKVLTAASSQLLTRHFEPHFEPFDGPFTQNQRIWRGGRVYCVQPDGTCTEWVEESDQQQKVDDIVLRSSRLYKIIRIHGNQEDKEEVEKIEPGQKIWIKNNSVAHLERWTRSIDQERKVGDLVEETQYQKITSITEEDGKLIRIKNACDELAQVSLKIQHACNEPTVTAWFDDIMGQFLDDTILFPGEKQEWMFELERKIGIWVTDTQSTLVTIKNNEKDIRSALDNYRVSWRDFIALRNQEIEKLLKQLVEEHKLYKTIKEAPAPNCSVEDLNPVLTQQGVDADVAINNQLIVCTDANKILQKEIGEADKHVESLQHILVHGQQRLDKKLELLVHRSIQMLVFKTSVELGTSVAQLIINAVGSIYTRFLFLQPNQQPLPTWTYNLNSGSKHKPVPSCHPFWHKPKHINTMPIQANTVKHAVPTAVDTLFSSARKKSVTPFPTKKTTPRSFF